MIATFIFVTVVLCVKKFNPSDNGLVSCAACAMTLFGMISMNAAETGGCINPAVAICLTVFDNIVYTGMSFSSLPIYFFACSLGGLIAGTLILTKVKLDGGKPQNFSELDAPEAENLIGRKMDAS